MLKHKYVPSWGNEAYPRLCLHKVYFKAGVKTGKWIVRKLLQVYSLFFIFIFALEELSQHASVKASDLIRIL